AACVGTEGNDYVVGTQPARIPQGCGHGRPGRSSHEQAFLARQFASGVKALRITHANPFVNHLAVERFGKEILADAFDAPRFSRLTGEDRTVGMGADDLDVGIPLLEVTADAGNRASRSSARDKCRDSPLRLLPDFGASCSVMRLWID